MGRQSARRTPDKIVYNVILDIEQPITVTAVDQRIVRSRGSLLLKRNAADPVATVAATYLSRFRLPTEWPQRRLRGLPERRIQS